MSPSSSSVFAFCGKWRETSKGDSLVPIMEAMSVSPEKIAHSLAHQNLLLSVSIKLTNNNNVPTQTLITTYTNPDDDSSKVVSSFEIDGKWKVGQSERVSRCAYSSRSKILVLDKQVSNTKFLRDERRVERLPETGQVVLRQRLELYHRPANPEKSSLVAFRQWVRVQDGADDTAFDAFVGRWTLNTKKSDSLQPLLELHKQPSLGLASKCDSQEILVCGPERLLFVSETSNDLVFQRHVYNFGASSKVNRVVWDARTKTPQLEFRQGECTETRLISVASSSQEEEMLQIIVWGNVRVVRKWNRVGRSFLESLPVALPLPSNRSPPHANERGWFPWSLPHFPMLTKNNTLGWILLQLVLFILLLWQGEGNALLSGLLVLGWLRAELLESSTQRWIFLSALLFIVLCLLSPLVRAADDKGYDAFLFAALVGIFYMRMIFQVNPASPWLKPSVFKQEGSDNGFAVLVPEYRDTPECVEFKVAITGIPPVWKRYRAFDSFRLEVNEREVPFPKKTWFSTRQPAFLETRRGELQSFLKQVFELNGNQDFLSDHVVRRFLDLPPI